jgi:hypothetical protein
MYTGCKVQRHAEFENTRGNENKQQEAKAGNQLPATEEARTTMAIAVQFSS